MELSTFDTVTLSEAGVDIPLKDIKTGRPTEVTFRVHGMDSEAFQQAKTEMARGIADAMESGATLTAARRTELASEMLAACTLGWSGVTVGGVELPFSTAAARDVYMRFPAVREQINQAIGDRANFVSA